MNKTLLAITALFLLFLASCGHADVDTGAKLSVLSQGVTVNGKVPTIGMNLNVGDVVATSPGAEAAVEFYNGSVVRLRENTSITIKKLTLSKDVVLSQERGQTWNRVTKLAGISSYSVETPNTVATVRGTGFKVTVDKKKTWVGVARGVVAVQKVTAEKVVSTELVPQDKQAEIFFEQPTNMTSDAILVQNLQTDEWIDENLEADQAFIEQVYAEANQEVPSDYIDEFSAHLANVTADFLNDSNDELMAQNETLNDAEATVEDVLAMNETDMNTTTIENTTVVNETTTTTMMNGTTANTDEAAANTDETTNQTNTATNVSSANASTTNATKKMNVTPTANGTLVIKL